MHNIRCYRRDVFFRNGAYHADADGSAVITSHSLADLVVAMRQCEEAWAAGAPPSWENPDEPISEVADLATGIPHGAVFDDPQGNTAATIHRLDDPYGGHPTYWLVFDGAIRAFSSTENAIVWRNSVVLFGIDKADLGIRQIMEAQGF